ncbi:precorrin-2 oxidase / ferrochelatase [Natrialba magadii ATCC 43099]|uniref:precorrin-2 dehydrogenase n=1 Tax=Natrialba magadii (strain ATCC 43099 / DSM 3394 / CCM 3739 / CIP 104546 / IAM 13178 / JCM 8861 / NBRC 102185 / NCIMB 2190 / MS3) TaxID=547559 RepID=D3SS76_NATMM|nr:bifunctional precorrin-2 dehydrogenase/sirohydrochlorin ferrochelatase [Natrialba magadii]ADD04802.1 precorrin-2 oxidase / ferrochelatase [Natrialba magadii ATCC 43099]ELY24469.1 siroheme synthase [Natrialba magadii ATCC 43099]
MIPLLHDFTDATVLIFGGGPVGARKARRFAREAEVIVVSPDFVDANEDGDADADANTNTNTNTDADFGDAARCRAAPAPDEIPDWLERTTPALVVAATDDEAVNDAIVTAARERGVLVNRADRAGEREPGSVVVPATVREDPVVVSIATGGTAPALSKYLRQELEETLDGAGEMARLCGELRAELKSQAVPPARRRELVTDVVNSPAVWTALRAGDPNVRQVIEDVLGEEYLSRGEQR